MLTPGQRRAMTALGLGLGASLVALALGRVPLVRTLDWKLYDQQVRWAADPLQARKDIVLVTIDELSLRRLEPVVGRWPWPRLVHAGLIDFLARAPAKVVAYDVLFTERDRRSGFDVGGETWSGAESDDAFAASIARAGNVVLLADATFDGLEPDAGVTPAEPETGEDFRALARKEGSPFPPAGDDVFEERPSVLLPFSGLTEAAQGIGHNYMVLDADGPVRRVVPFVRHDDRLVPALSIAAFVAATGIDPRTARVAGDQLLIGDRRVPLVTDLLPRFSGAAPEAPTWGRRMLVDFRGPAVLPDGRSTTYRRYSFYDLFYSEQQLLAGEAPFVKPAEFRDTLVFVGVTAAGLHDVFTVPFGESGKMPGPQVHASVVDQLLAGRFLSPAARSTGVLATVVLGLAAALFLTLLPVRLGATIVVLAGAALGAGSMWTFARGVWLPLATPLLAAALAGVGGLGYRYLVEGREKRAVKQLFSRYLSRDVYEQVLANPALAELGGARRDMSVLFSDIRGFTAITEKGNPEALVAQLNQYFSRMVDIVFAHRGTLDKFVGDMVMALFSAPLDDPRHADHAVEAALAMVAELARLNEMWTKEGRPNLGIGIGINSGEMIAGNIGSEKIRSYTVLGDHVNLGARLESLNKEYGTSIIISEYTAKRLTGQYDLRPLGDVVVKGKTVAVKIFEVRPPGRDPGAAGTREGTDR